MMKKGRGSSGFPSVKSALSAVVLLLRSVEALMQAISGDLITLKTVRSFVARSKAAMPAALRKSLRLQRGHF
jgi:hypothetical protein